MICETEWKRDMVWKFIHFFSFLGKSRKHIFRLELSTSLSHHVYNMVEVKLSCPEVAFELDGVICCRQNHSNI